MYMPSHEEDLPLIPYILNSIRQRIISNINHNIILLGEFNKDIALIEYKYNEAHIPPSEPTSNGKLYTHKSHRWFLCQIRPN